MDLRLRGAALFFCRSTPFPESIHSHRKKLRATQSIQNRRTFQELFKVQEKSWARRPSHRNHGQNAHAASNFEQFLPHLCTSFAVMKD